MIKSIMIPEDNRVTNLRAHIILALIAERALDVHEAVERELSCGKHRAEPENA
jgi:hypothetical protein